MGDWSAPVGSPQRRVGCKVSSDESASTGCATFPDEGASFVSLIQQSWRITDSRCSRGATALYCERVHCQCRDQDGRRSRFIVAITKMLYLNT